MTKTLQAAARALMITDAMVDAYLAANAAALQIGGADSQTPTPFQAGYALACEEIETRLRTQQWVLGDVPAPLPPPAGSAA